ncbi:MAG: hypothetical protein U5L72_12465 [Bacteroidales bacterium]|nr:hypothetical protein [Bacteroidales bacterium]
MKKLLVIIFLSKREARFLFGQAGSGSGPFLIRLNGYTTYAFDDNHVDAYNSATSYFDGALKGGFEWGGGLEVLPVPSKCGAESLYLRL